MANDVVNAVKKALESKSIEQIVNELHAHNGAYGPTVTEFVASLPINQMCSCGVRPKHKCIKESGTGYGKMCVNG